MSNSILSLIHKLFFFSCFISLFKSSAVHKPTDFLWGVALSEYQVSGRSNCPFSNWAAWEQNSGKACDYWNRWRDDIVLLQEIGVNSLRLSVEWSNIEPIKGQFSEKALQHYESLCDALIAQGITPCITLHHFTHPLWFEKLGAFEKEHNISYFVRFCKKLFERLGNKVHLWCTINEPTIYILQGYIRGVYPPGKKNMALGLTVLKNLLKAHVRVYSELKNMPYGCKAQIGIAHQYLTFEHYSSWNPLERICSNFLTSLLNETVLRFFATGKFRYSLPSIAYANYRAPRRQKYLDFIGINYYSRVILKSQWGTKEFFTATCLPDEIMTDMPYPIYPQGLYQAIARTARIGVPIYITETGIADAQDNKRELFIKQYLAALQQALADGYDVRGFYYWSLLDNLEWDLGYSMKFGLYKVDFKTQERTLRKGARYYAQAIQAFKRSL